MPATTATPVAASSIASSLSSASLPIIDIEYFGLSAVRSMPGRQEFLDVLDRGHPAPGGDLVDPARCGDLRLHDLVAALPVGDRDVLA